MCYNKSPRTSYHVNDIYSITILDKKWDIVFCDKKDDQELNDCDGYTSTRQGERKMVIAKDAYQSKEQILRHELIHAFLFETGLGFCSDWATNEEMVDYFARNWTKIDNIMNNSIDKIIDK